MGILNITPDSFSDGGDFLGLDAALEQAERMVAAGASIIDVGGESTRPGAAPVAEAVEIDRVVPVIEALAAGIDAAISVDTSKAGVMQAAAAAGAGMINDVFALQAPQALEAARQTGLPVCLMHMQGQPRTMQQAPRYADVLTEVEAFLRGRLEACEQAGLPEERLLIDPGFGFGKTLEHNLQLLARLDAFSVLKRPLLVGLSRKSMLGALTGRAVRERVTAGVAAAVLAIERGAAIIRTHDVAETRDAIRVMTALRAVQDGGALA
ncbi:dihydropteroate synthase [Halochromatium glycolicum]|uniref:dihydropteroate synthase n=1 Tax=Halochromatium glycolicum TaxID=85075 RepID=A0AAJ0X8U2_9GAMM|nr:dihydropteroate synthase [Halochromatium glycolicum]MBK1703503.1 dihydropteroate synthase [Halochromatium glycolicum]